MRALRDFGDFIRRGIVRKVTPNPARARSLVEAADKRLAFIGDMSGRIGISDANADYYVENCYDALIELLRAHLIILGYSSSGLGAHEAEVSHMRDLGFSEKEVRFMNDLRFFRNGIKYYGKTFDGEYGALVVDFLNRLYPRLRKAVTQKLEKKKD